MFKPPSQCSNETCAMHNSPIKGFLRKRGTYHSKRTGKTLQRYQCKECGTIFTRQTGSNPLGHRKEITQQLFGLVCSGTTLRRSAILLGVSVNTIRSRMLVLAEKARAAHAQAISTNSLQTKYVLFDEMITFLHSRPKALSIALAVRNKTGQILSIKVGRIPAFGKLAARGAAMGWTVNDGPATRAAALQQAALSVKPFVTFACDGATSYPAAIKLHVGNNVQVVAHPSRKGTQFDPLFKLNHVCAKIRADIACMARETWTTTKDIKRLQDRLDIYVAWNNRYDIFKV